MTDQSTMLREILATLKQLVQTDKQVHSEVDKADEKPPEEEEEGEKEEPEKEEKKAVKKAEDSTVTKAAMEQDFQKALDAAISPLRAELDLLKAEVQKIGDEPLFKAGYKLTDLNVDHEGKPEMGNAGALAAQRKKNQQKV